MLDTGLRSLRKQNKDVLYILQQFQKNSDESEASKDLCGKGLAELKNGDGITVFGAGSATKEILPLLTDIIKIKVKVILDNNAVAPYELLGHKVINPKDTELKNHYIVVFVASGRPQIDAQLNNLNVNQENIFFPEIRKLQFYSHILQWYLDDAFLLKQASLIQKTYDLLQDDHSKNLFLSRLGLMSQCPDYQMFQKFVRQFSKLPGNNSVFDNKAPECFLYFNSNRIKELDSVLIDVGVCDGDSIYHYTKKNSNQYDQIIGFEPDLKNYNTLINKYHSDKRIKILNYAAWDKEQDLEFASFGSGMSHVLDFDVDETDFGDSDSTSTFIQGIPIDNLSIKNRRGIIQVDVEGSEHRVISGMRKTLLNNRFELIVSCYHKKFDIVDLILQINKIRSDYTFGLELLSDGLLELNIFATL